MAKQTFILPKLMARDRAICRIVDALEDLPATEGFRVEIHEHKATRTEKQNRTLWWIYETIIAIGGVAMEGFTKEDLHDFFLIHHFGSTTKTLFRQKRRKPIRRSSKLSKSEFALFVEAIYNFMANEGVILPQPDPDYAIERDEETS